MSTKETIYKILNEIENGNGSYSSKRLSTEQVIDKLLNKKSTQSELRKNIGPNNNYHFDIEELSLWKNNNNSFYKINYYHPIICVKKLVGKPLVFVNKVVRKIFKFIGQPIVEQQNKFNGSITASVNALYNNEIVTQNFIYDIISKVSEINNKILNLESKLEYSNNTIKSFESKLEYSNNTIKSLEGQLNSSITNITSTIDEKLKCIDDKNQVIDNQMDYLNFKVHQMSTKKFDIKDKQQISQINELDEANTFVVEESDDYTYQSIDYFDFENHFRGSRDVIKDRQKDYIKYFQGKNNIIDLGCGRGEFLELLKENNIPALGIDLYPEFVDYCLYKNLNATQADAIKYLNKLEDNTVDGIICSQVVEHLLTEQVFELCNLAYRKLKDNAYLIIETPNPTCLSIYTNGFYVDPSHVKPVHPLTLEYFLKKAGFKDTQVIYTEQSKVNYKLPLLKGQNIENIEEFNDGVNLLNNIIFGSQDYAIIAKK